MVFIENVCLWPYCNQHFVSTEDLIQHIEEDHVHYDAIPPPRSDDEKPETVHLSLIHRFFTDEQLAERHQHQQFLADQTDQGTFIMDLDIDSPEDAMMKRKRCKSESAPHVFFDEVLDSFDDTDTTIINNRDSNDSGLPSPESLSSSCGDRWQDRPYVCPVPGCGKRYKNPNGIKYHTLHGHTGDVETKKPFRCHMYGCGKRYKNASGLKQHLLHSHPREPLGNNDHLSVVGMGERRTIF